MRAPPSPRVSRKMLFCDPPVSCSTLGDRAGAGKTGLRRDPLLESGPVEQAVEIGERFAHLVLPSRGVRAIIAACCRRSRARIPARRLARPARRPDDHPVDPSLPRRAGAARRAAGDVVRRQPRAERIEPSTVPLPRAHRQRGRARGEGAHRRRRATGVGDQARPTATTVVRVRSTTRRRRAWPARCRRTSTSSNARPCSCCRASCATASRHRPKARRSTRRVRTCCSRRALGYGGVLTLWHGLVEPSCARCSACPTTCSWPRRSRSAVPAGHHGPVRRRPLSELVFADRWGHTRTLGRRPPGTLHVRTAAGDFRCAPQR